MATTETELDDVASRALAAMFLEATAVMVESGGTNSAEQLTKLSEDTGIVLDVTAAILMATAWLAGAGELTGEAIYAAALALTPDDEPVSTDG